MTVLAGIHTHLCLLFHLLYLPSLFPRILVTVVVIGSDRVVTYIAAARPLVVVCIHQVVPLAGIQSRDHAVGALCAMGAVIARSDVEGARLKRGS